MEERTTTQPFCEKHNAFLADRFVEGTCPLCQYPDARGDQCDKCGHLLDPLDLLNPRCKLDGATPEARSTKHVFLLLDKLQPAIEKWSQQASNKGAWSSNGIIITESWLKEGLKPRGITRDLKWGTAIPSFLEGYDNKVLYVWFDACIGYVSITANYTDQWEKWWRDPDNVQLYQFMGKDNVPFHTVVFPGSQLGTGDKWTMLHHLSTTEYLNYENGKFSKSRGIGVFGGSAKETGVPADVWRYYLLSHRPETGDTEFEWSGFIAANNNELLKNLVPQPAQSPWSLVYAALQLTDSQGNFCNRVVKFVNSKVYDSVVPNWTEYTDGALEEHKKDVNSHLKRYIFELDAVKLKAGLVTAMHISSLGNSLLQHNKLGTSIFIPVGQRFVELAILIRDVVPDNKLATDEPQRCAAVVGLAINHVHLLASVIAPYMPATSQSILEQLNASLLIIPDHWEAASIEPGHKIGQAAYLFSQIKPEREQEWRERFGGEEARRQKLLEEEKRAKKKAEKERRKQKKQNGGAAGMYTSSPCPRAVVARADIVRPAKPESVEAVEKDGAQNSEKTAIEEVTEGVKQAVLQTS